MANALARKLSMWCPVNATVVLPYHSEVGYIDLIFRKMIIIANFFIK